ncbi:hypothetical protein QFZ50_002637 [Arthrobacter agilis]|jgi:hypothetical protein|nr:hypothetical protein [Arthrobacter agilis]
MGDWSKSRILFLAVGVVLVGIGLWLIVPALVG